MIQFDVEAPRWSQDSFVGRFRHFASITNPLNAFHSRETLYASKRLVEACRQNQEVKGATLKDLYRAQKLYKSAFHPDTGEMQTLLGRMSFQVPAGMAVVGAMLTWHRTTSQVVFLQWCNQSLMATVNYTNRNANLEVDHRQLIMAYLSATAAAVLTSLGMKRVLEKTASSLTLRFVPGAAVAAANCVNVPLMRQNELREGIPVMNEKNEVVGISKVAAYKAISLTVVSRLIMGVPSLIVVPIMMERIEPRKWFIRRRTMLNAPLQTLLSGIVILLTVPLGCAAFPQKSSISLRSIEKINKQEFEVLRAGGSAKLYFNKGL